VDRPAPEKISGFKITNVLDMAAVDEGQTVHLDVDIAKSVARGRELFCSASFDKLQEPLTPTSHLGVDMLRLGPGESFPMHTHPGHHCLPVVRGRGTVTFDGVVHPTKIGDLYLVDGEVPHAVGAAAREAHYILSFGAPHKHVDDPDRMTVVPEPQHGA